MLQNQLNYVVREKRGKGVRERGKGVRGKTRLGEGQTRRLQRCPKSAARRRAAKGNREVPVFVGFSFFPLSHEGVPSFLPVRQHI